MRTLTTLFRKTKKKETTSTSPTIYVVSYPKSGRTWLRALIGKYLSLKHGLTDDRLLLTEEITDQSGLPTVSFSHSGWGMQNAKKKQSKEARQQTYDHVILLSRDIKDTLVSAYFQATKRQFVFEGPMSAFIRTELYGVKKILRFYKTWLSNKERTKSFLYTSYEDLHEKPEQTLTKIMNFIGEKEVDESLIRQSVAFCSFDNLHKLERDDKFRNNELRAANLDDLESYKTRKGKVGNHGEYLSESDQRYIDEEIQKSGIDFVDFL